MEVLSSQTHIPSIIPPTEAGEVKVSSAVLPLLAHENRRPRDIAWLQVGAFSGSGTKGANVSCPVLNLS